MRKNLLVLIVILAGFIPLLFIDNSYNNYHVDTILGASSYELPIVFNTTEGDITLAYTDDNTDEDLIIVSDKRDYNDGLSGTDVYFTILSGNEIDADVQFLFESNEDLVFIKQYKEVIETIETPIMSEYECGTEASSTICTEQTGTSTELVTKGVWEDVQIESLLGGDKDKFKADKKAKVKVPKYKDKSLGAMGSETYYPLYKAHVNYGESNNGEFFIEVMGDDGSYGILDPWFNSSWTYRIPIEINSSYVDSTLSSFPVYLDLADLPSDFHTNVKSDGCDIRIVESDETTETAFELVSYASSTDTGELHFMADSLSSSATTTFYVYYGNSGASCYATDATYGAENVWGNYVAVWHFENGSTDSTVNNYTGTANGGLPDSVSGKLGMSQSFDGNGDYFDMGDETDFDIDDAGGIDKTIQAWIKPSDPVYSEAILGKWGSQTSQRNWLFRQETNYTVRFFSGSGGSTGQNVQSTATITDGNWGMTHFSWDASANDINLYVNGGDKQTNTNVTTISASTAKMAVGAEQGTGTQGSAYNYSGLIDEIRIRNTILDDDWIATEYDNQNTPEPFYYIGTQETDTATSTPSVYKQSEFWFVI